MSKYIALIKNVGLFTISNVALKFIIFLLTPLYTYYLTTGQFGLTDMLNTSISLVTPVVTLSIADAALRFLIEDKYDAVMYVSISFYLSVVSCFVVVVLLPLLDLSMFGGLGRYKGYFFAAYCLMTFQALFSNFARGFDQVSIMTEASVLSSVVNIVFAIVLIAGMRMKVEGFFLSVIAANFAACIFYLWRGKYLKYLRKPDMHMLPMAKQMLLYSLPLVPNAVFWWVSQSINRFFLTSMLGIGISGIFAAASKLPSMLNMLSGIFQQAWNLSAFQESKKQGKNRFFSVVFSVYNAVMSLCVMVLVPICKWIAGLLLQKQFASAWILIPTLLLSFYYAAISAFFGSFFTASMKTKPLFSTTIAGGVVCIIGTYVLVKICGVQGAAIASALSNAVVLLLRLILSKRIYNLPMKFSVFFITNMIMVISAVVMVSTSHGMIVSIFLFLVDLTIFIWDLMRLSKNSRESK